MTEIHTLQLIKGIVYYTFDGKRLSKYCKFWTVGLHRRFAQNPNPNPFLLFPTAPHAPKRRCSILLVTIGQPCKLVGRHLSVRPLLPPPPHPHTHTHPPTHPAGLLPHPSAPHLFGSDREPRAAVFLIFGGSLPSTPTC